MNGWIPILVYHRVADVPKPQDPLRLCTSPRSLERVLRYFSEHGYRFVSLGEAVTALERGGSSERLVCLTFDDGYRDFLTDAFPLLQRFNSSATVFLVSDFIGGDNRWDACYGLAPLPLLSSGEVLTLSGQGVEFGSHSLTHRHLTQIDPWQQAREIRGSREALESLLGRPVGFFAYPHADQDRALREEVRRAGYFGAVGGEQAEHEPFLLHRVDVSHTTWPATLFRIWGWRWQLQRNERLRRWKRRLQPSPAVSRRATEAGG